MRSAAADGRHSRSNTSFVIFPPCVSTIIDLEPFSGIRPIIRIQPAQDHRDGCVLGARKVHHIAQLAAKSNPPCGVISMAKPSRSLPATLEAGRFLTRARQYHPQAMEPVDMDGIEPNWPKHLLVTHAIELALNAYFVFDKEVSGRRSGRGGKKPNSHASWRSTRSNT